VLEANNIFYAVIIAPTKQNVFRGVGFLPLGFFCFRPNVGYKCILLEGSNPTGKTDTGEMKQTLN